MYEVYYIEKATVVSWFWGKGDVVIPTSPYSTLITGEKAKTTTMTYGHMFRPLRGFEEFRGMYRGIIALLSSQRTPNFMISRTAKHSEV